MTITIAFLIVALLAFLAAFHEAPKSGKHL
jgi:hypothetical protein